MQYSKIASAILLLASTALSAPTPQADFEAPFIGVGLQGANDEGALTFLMDEKALTAGQRSTFSVAETTVFETLELVVGANFPELESTLRCQITSKSGTPLFVLRGTNRDDTFSDAGKGRWTLEKPSQVGEIICDPAFKANNRAAAPADDSCSCPTTA